MKQKDKTLEVTTALDSEMYRHMMNIVSFLLKKNVNIFVTDDSLRLIVGC